MNKRNIALSTMAVLATLSLAACSSKKQRRPRAALVAVRP